MEDLDLRDFVDVVYAYALNGTPERSDFRTAMLGYAFDFDDGAGEEDLTHEGFVKAATSKSMLDELDAFGK